MVDGAEAGGQLAFAQDEIKKRLNGIQWIPGDGTPPPEEWLPLLKRIRDGGKLCQLYVSPEGALRIVRTLGGKGFAFYILTPIPPGVA